jgi:hypothetical protein
MRDYVKGHLTVEDLRLKRLSYFGRYSYLEFESARDVTRAKRQSGELRVEGKVGWNGWVLAYSC